MGNLVIVFKIMPESTEVDLDVLKTEVKQRVDAPAELQGFEVAPIAFGLKALKVTIVTDDEAGGQDELEDALREIPGVGSVSIEDMGRF